MSKDVTNILSNMSYKELNDTIYEVEKDFYECMPVDIMTFVNDPYYLGATYGDRLFKIWEDTLKEIYPTPLFSPYYEVLLSAAIGAGKCLAKGTKVLMYGGTIKNVEDIKPSDLLLGPDNKKRLVTSTCSGRELMYKITLQDGSNFTCNKSHIITLRHNTTYELNHFNVEDVYNNLEEYEDYYAIKYNDSTQYKYTIQKQNIDEYYGFTIEGDYESKLNNIDKCFVLGNGIITHNTSVSVIGMLYDIHKLLCLKDPQAYYGLTQNTTIAFSLFSATLSLATDVNWTSLVDALRESPYFCEQLEDSKVLDNNAKTSMIPLAKNIGLQIGSNFKHTIGKAVFGSLLDEASFQNSSSERNQAQDTYNALSSRADSRYANSILYNPLPGHQWLASSPQTATDFLAVKINKSEGRKGILVKKDIALWHAKPHLMQGDKFYVLVGDKETQSQIVDDYDSLTPDMKAKCHEVPEMFRGSFEDDLDLAIQDKLGLSITSASNLFKTNEGIVKAMCYENPFKREVINNLTFMGDDSIMDYMNKPYFRNLKDRQYNRFIMLDAGLTNDIYGITGMYAKPISNDIIQESEYAKASRTYHADFSIGIKAIKGDRINFQKIRNFIDYLVNEMDYPLVKIGADNFQSEDMLQYYKLKGFETEKVSVVTDPTIYEQTRDAIENGSLFLTKSIKLENELMNLRKVYKSQRASNTNKSRNYMYDHPPVSEGGSKDIADSLAGAYRLANSYPTLINPARQISTYFDVSEEEKEESYYNNLTDDEFLEELKKLDYKVK